MNHPDTVPVHRCAESVDMTQPHVPERSPVVKAKVLVALAIVLASWGGNMGYQIVQDGLRVKVSMTPQLLLAFVMLTAMAVRCWRVRCDTLELAAPAGLIRRLSATSVDVCTNWVLVFCPIVCAAMFLSWAATGELRWEYDHSINTEHPVLAGLGCFLVCVGLVITYIVLFAWPVSRQRQSVGHFFAGMVILSEKGPMSLRDAVFRLLLGIITVVLGAISIPLAYVRRDRKLWHDCAYHTSAMVVVTWQKKTCQIDSSMPPRVPITGKGR